MNRARSTFREYPTKFWVLVGATFIDRLGGTLIFPFFALYITQKFNVGMTQAGFLFGIFSVAGFFGNLMGGALTDKIGRRSIVLFGLIFSALSSVSMGLVDELTVFYTLAVVVGFLSDVAGPARGAMIADILPEEQQAEGFGILRVAANLSWVIGPTIGGFLASRSYLLLFVLDAVSSLITAAIVFRMIPETKPETAEDGVETSILSTFAGYRDVAGDKVFMAFIFASMLMTVAYLQLYSTLSVYLRDVHNVPTQAFGALMSANATSVVLFQFWVTRKVKRVSPMLMMMLGTGLYMVGFTMYGIVGTYPLFLLAMLLITFGEMVVMPVAQAIVARLAPVDKRGRYMAFFGFSYQIPAAIGPWAAGLIMDNLNPDWVWFAAGIVSAMAILGFYMIHLRGKARFVSQLEGEIQQVPAT